MKLAIEVLLDLRVFFRAFDLLDLERNSQAQREVAYHVERSGELVIALGDGTRESRARMQAALDALWPYAGELFIGDAVDARLAQAGVAPAAESLRPAWTRATEAVFAQGALTPPTSTFAHKGGRSGRHTGSVALLHGIS